MENALQAKKQPKEIMPTTPSREIVFGAM